MYVLMARVSITGLNFARLLQSQIVAFISLEIVLNVSLDTSLMESEERLVCKYVMWTIVPHA